MCQMKVLLRQGGAESVLVEDASFLEADHGGVRVTALLDQPKVIPHAMVSAIDFLHGKVILTQATAEKPAADPRTATEKLRVLLPHWVEHNCNHEAEFRKWSGLARAEGGETLAKLLDEAAAQMASTDKVLKKLLVAAGVTTHAHDGHAPHHHHHHH